MRKSFAWSVAVCGALALLSAGCKNKTPTASAPPETPAAIAPAAATEAAPVEAAPAETAAAVLEAPAVEGAAASSLGPATVKRQSQLHIRLAQRDLMNLVSCPPAQKMEDMQECDRKRAEAAEKDIQPAAGKVFVVVSFEQAPADTPIKFSSPETSLDLPDGTKLRAHAVQVQGTKYEGDKRVPWPESNHVETEIWMSTYLPLAGEPPFTVVFEAPAAASQGTFVAKGVNLPLRW